MFVRREPLDVCKLLCACGIPPGMGERKFGPDTVKAIPGMPGDELGLTGRDAKRKTGADVGDVVVSSPSRAPREPRRRDASARRVNCWPVMKAPR